MVASGSTKWLRTLEFMRPGHVWIYLLASAASRVDFVGLPKVLCRYLSMSLIECVVMLW